MFGRKELVDLVGDVVYPAYKAERDRLDVIDRWARWDNDKPVSASQATREHKELAARAATPLARLIVNSVVQELYVEGYRRPKEPEDERSWHFWQGNGLDAKQLPVHRTALNYGEAYVQVLPGATTLGEPMPAIRGVSPREMLTFWEDQAWDDWPIYGARFQSVKDSYGMAWKVTIIDVEEVHTLRIDSSGKIEFVTSDWHGIGVCPIIRFANDLDLEGRQTGDVEPFIPVLGRIDQTVYDRLLVQRHSSWVTKTISGMVQPDDEEVANRTKFRLSVEDILISEDPDTRFGSIPGSDMAGFIRAMEIDLQILAAVSQTPAYELTGDLINLSADALVAARVSLQRRIDERRQSFGKSWEQTLRLASRVMGDSEGAQAWDAQVRWRDTEGRSLSQAADALGKLAQMLNVPVELLWERIPGWTQQDVNRAKELVKEADPMRGLFDNFEAEMRNGGFNQTRDSAN